MRTWLRMASTLAASATATWTGARAAGAVGGARLQRTNFAGRQVSLAGGFGVAAGATTAAALANPALLPAVVAGAVAGAIDDLDQGAHDGDGPAKGLHGHLAALARGQVTTGVVKIAMIGSGALASGAALNKASSGSRLTWLGQTLASGVGIAAWANVHNLLDLRPGRALKVAALVSLSQLPSATAARQLAGAGLAVAAAGLPADLGERHMLGDTGANALGALVGGCLVCHRAPAPALAALSGTALVLASEKVSFSQVIARTPVLAALDSAGRRAA